MAAQSIMMESVWHGGVAYRREQLLAITDRLDAAVDAGRQGRLAVRLPDGPLLAATLCWANRARFHVVLCDVESGSEDPARLLDIGCDYLVTTDLDPATMSLDVRPLGTRIARAAWIEPRVGLFTSGSTGIPKLIEHTWDGLRQSVRVSSNLKAARWMSMYPLTRFAGCNILLHAMWNEGTLVIPASGAVGGLLAALEQGMPTHVSGTPTMWKALLMTMDGGDWIDGVRQVTLGGEIADQSILSALRLRFPLARISNIYASTEAGVCLVVSDDLPGFPLRWLDGERRAVQLRIRGEELWVRRRPESPDTRDEAAEDGWWNTGDRVEVRGDRVYFLGRGTDVLNVGGAKVSPALVEEKLLEVPGVRNVRVTGRKSALAGTLLVAEVVSSPERDQGELRRELFAHCSRTLPRYAVPRLIEFVAAVPVAHSGKMVRGEP